MNFKNKYLTKNVLCIPDFDSYKILNPSALFMLENSFLLKNREITKTYFEYGPVSYMTNFAVHDFFKEGDKKELYINIEIKRNYFNVFISKVMSIFVVALLLFATLLFVRKYPEVAKDLGASPGGMLGTYAGMFFIIILSHIDTLAKLDIDKIFYFEYYYFLMYFYFLFLTINIIIFSMTESCKIIHYKDNLIPRLCYWSVLFLMIYIVTMTVFY